MAYIEIMLTKQKKIMTACDDGNDGDMVKFCTAHQTNHWISFPILAEIPIINDRQNNSWSHP